MVSLVPSRAWWGEISNICILMYDFMQLPARSEEGKRSAPPLVEDGYRVCP